MDSFQYAKEVKAEVELVVAMTRTDNWRRTSYLRALRLKSLKEALKNDCEDPMRKIEFNHAEACRRRHASKRKAEEELVAKESKKKMQK